MRRDKTTSPSFQAGEPAAAQAAPRDARDGSEPPACPLLGLDLQALTELVTRLGQPPYRARQLERWLYVRRVTDPEQMSDLPRALRVALVQHVRKAPALPVLQQTVCAADGSSKLLFRLHDTALVEGVLIPGRPGELTQCISSQVGCPFDCAFCRTGDMGLVRNLQVSEILGQVAAAQAAIAEGLLVRRLVFMGMGEPLANFEQLAAALPRLVGPQGMGFGPRRITISTAGVPGALHRLRGLGQYQLAVSLGGTTEQQRARLMPKAAALQPLASLLEECRQLELAPTEHLTFELVLVGGVNDTLDDARRLIGLTSGLRSKVNLIPLNEHPGTDLAAPTEERVRAFQQRLVKAGRPTSIRRSRGGEELAACGQLATSTRRRGPGARTRS